MTRLLVTVGIMLLAGFVVSMLSPVPAIDSGRTVPVRDGELWELNPK